MGMLLRRRISEIAGNGSRAEEPAAREEAAVRTVPEGDDLPFSDADIMMETAPARYAKEELEVLTVRRIRELAADLGFEITKIIKSDVIREFLEKQG